MLPSSRQTTGTLDTTVVQDRSVASNSKKKRNRVSLHHNDREPPGSCLNIKKFLVCSPGKGLDLRARGKELNQCLVRDENGKIKDRYLDYFRPECHGGNGRGT